MRLTIPSALTLLAFLTGCATSAISPPHLQQQGTATQLIVDGKPYLALAGELHNSSATSLDYMAPIWPKLAAMHLNTVLAAVTWEQVEPTEGQFDFSIVDGLLQQARQNNLHIVFLWFGSWKNGTSRYQPAWVKADQKRFPLVVNKDGNSLEILSTFNDANRDADSTAYAAFMRHVAEVDSQYGTVIMIQMENEVGVLGDSRDRSPAANAAFAGKVPPELLDYLQAHKDNLLPPLRKIWEAAGFKTSGTWEEIFGAGPSTDEIFMAWNYARYMNHVSAAGKAEYPLPTYCNTWIVQPQDKGPGDYPSGGAVSQVHDIWRAAGTAIDMLCPDIYLPDFPGIVQMYSQPGYPVFIPETRGGAGGAANAFYLLGQCGGIGFSPFGIETEDPNGPLSKAYSALSDLAPLILQYQGTPSIAAVLLSRDNPSQKISLGDYTLNVELRRTRNSTALPNTAYVLAINTGPNEYVLAGSDAQITFTPNTPGPAIVGLAKVQEDLFVGGQWIPGRWLNGDEVQLRYDLSPAAADKLSGSGIRLQTDGPFIQRVQLYRYQ